MATWKKQAQRKGSTGKGLIQSNSSGLLKRLPHQALLEQLADRQPAQIGRADPGRTRQFVELAPRSGCSLISNRVVGSFVTRPRYDHQPSFLSTHRRSDGVPTRRKGRGNYAAAKKEPRQEPRLRLC